MISDETLILYYFDDGLTDKEKNEVEISLKIHSELKDRYDRLCTQLDPLRDTETPSVPSHLVHRWQETLSRAVELESREKNRRGNSPRLWLLGWAMTITAALVLGIGIGIHFWGDPQVRPQGAYVQDVGSSTSFSRSLLLHLQESKWQIVSLKNQSTLDQDRLLLQIIEQNRLFQRAAVLNQSADLARVLRAFEPILLSLADETMKPEDAEALRRQLAFEIGVMLTKLSKYQSDITPSI